MGLTPYQSYNGGDIDSVSLSTGGLSIHSPLVSYPQRGGLLQETFSLMYNSKPFYIKQICVPDNGCSTYWYHGGSSGNTAVVEDQYESSPASKLLVHQNPTVYDCYFSAQDSDQAKHPLGQTAGSVICTNNSDNTTFESIDATGYHMVVDAAGNFTITDASGIKYNLGNGVTQPTVWKEDPNGNQISRYAGGLTDTLGRQIPTVPTFATGGSDSSSCPQGGTLLPISSASVWSPPGYNGGSLQIKFCYATVAVNILAGAGGADSGGDANIAMLQSIVLLGNNTAWNFEYNDRDPGDPQTVNYGSLTKITLPTGGTISYAYNTNFSLLWSTDLGSRWIASRTIDANDGTGNHTSTYTWYTAHTTNTVTNVVTDPMGNDGAHTFTLLDSNSLYETTAQYYQGAKSANQLLKTVTTQYTWDLNEPFGNIAVNVVPTSITTAWANGQTSEVAKSYDSGFSYGSITAHYGKVVTESEYDYGSGAAGPLLRKTSTAYKFQGDPNYLARNLLNLPASIQVTDGGGTQRAYTTYVYDAGTRASSTIATQRDTNPPDSPYFGNLTSIGRWLSTTGGNLTSNNTYFDTGTVQIATDPKGNSVTYSYSSTYAGAYPTTVTNALTQSTTYAYDFSTGLLTSRKDPNLQVTTFAYDNLLRLATVTDPDGGLVNITHQESSFPFSATLTKKITSSPLLNYITTNLFDGFGRVTQNQLTSDPIGPILTDTSYDADGREYAVSNPYRSKTESTYGVTSYVYDALGRTCVVVPPDGTAVTNASCPAAPPSNDVFTVYTGNTALVTDQQGKSRKSQTDGLGRLTSVWEDPTALNYQTNYTYDALDDLVTVVQNSSRNRNFTYDSLKRLTSASNPESGTVSYVYDADGNVLTKKDARNITTTYTYDSLNRLTSKSYSDGTANVTYAYDGNAPSGCSTGVSSYGLAIGKRTAMCDAAAGVESWVYNDILNTGWQVTDKRTTNGVTESTIRQNNLARSLASLTYPSGRAITYSYNGALRPVSAVDISNGVNYATSAAYAPQGAVTALTNGASLVSTLYYDRRLQPCRISIKSSGAAPTQCSDSGNIGNLLDYTFNFGLGVSDNGNVTSLTNNRVPNRSQSFAYDNLNRITTATTTATHATDPADCWGESYQYDNQTTGGAWGNLTSIGVASSAYNGCTQESLSVIVSGNNQMNGNGYDAAGNMTAASGVTYNYNAENQLTTTESVNYTYDGDGKRVEKSNGTLYWYGGESDPIAESNLSGGSMDEYVFFGGKRIARRKSTGEIDYYFADHLGTSRMVVSSTGTILDDSDFYPFGGERPAIPPTSGNAFKFTCKERDAESGNDYFGARYYASSMGRWLSPDWSAKVMPVPYAKLDNPQSLNLYAYVGNNPLIHVDADGHIIDDSALKDNKKYQQWKTNYLSHAGAQAQWDALNNNKDLTVTMKWDSKGTQSVTDGYQFNGKGQLTAATVTLAAKTGNSDYHMSAESGYVHGSTITDSKLQSAYVVAHEFGHVEQAEAPGGQELIDQRHADGEFTQQKYAEMGIQNALKDPAVAAANQRLMDSSHQLETGADQRAWDIVGPKQ
jgi:RHS repeat-associated protein